MTRGAVFNGSKILIWKQITTKRDYMYDSACCIQWFKDTNLKANHNCQTSSLTRKPAVFNGSKILIWKQITTKSHIPLIFNRCIQWFKDTNLKANHNSPPLYISYLGAVFNGSKILIWKQITTLVIGMAWLIVLYSMVQRY